MINVLGLWPVWHLVITDILMKSFVYHRLAAIIVTPGYRAMPPVAASPCDGL